MSENIQSAFTFDTPSNYAYACAYAIQKTPITNAEEDGDVTTFLAPDGLVTTWPCDAQHFDDAEHAFAKLMTMRGPRTKGADGHTYPRVVRLHLQCQIEAVTALAVAPEEKKIA
jgi:hypothetical protein